MRRLWPPLPSDLGVPGAKSVVNSGSPPWRTGQKSHSRLREDHPPHRHGRPTLTPRRSGGESEPPKPRWSIMAEEVGVGTEKECDRHYANVPPPSRRDDPAPKFIKTQRINEANVFEQQFLESRFFPQEFTNELGLGPSISGAGPSCSDDPALNLWICCCCCCCYCCCCCCC